MRGETHDFCTLDSYVCWVKLGATHPTAHDGMKRGNPDSPWRRKNNRFSARHARRAPHLRVEMSMDGITWVDATPHKRKQGRR